MNLDGGGSKRPQYKASKSQIKMPPIQMNYTFRAQDLLFPRTKGPYGEPSLPGTFVPTNDYWRDLTKVTDVGQIKGNIR